MASFANLTASLNLNIQNFASNMRRASSMANQFSANLKGQLNGGLVEPAKKSKVEFKDVARIVQGIMISKVFYGSLNAIRNCTSATIEFAQSLEYAKIAYSNLFNDTALADEFINVLKDFAATTPFSFSESEAAAKRLLAYGIQYKNVMYVMQGILSASAMQGNPQVIESVSRAFGQIYTKGRLMNEEMRQLAEAGIPAYDILQEKLGLTQAQLQNLGDIAIPASKAINALVVGMQERFGGVVAASSKTMVGIISNIKDNALMLMSAVVEPLTVKLKSILNVLGEFLFRLREIAELKGIGGVFEALVPPELQSAVRHFIANLINLFQAIMRLVASLKGLLRPALESVMRVFNVLVPILTTVINVLAEVVRMITSNSTAMRILTSLLTAAITKWILFKVAALATSVVAGVITLISKALAGLSTMLTFVVAHPFWAMLIGLTGLIVGLSGGFGKLSDAISGMFKRLTAFNGIDPDKILLPSQKERANDINKFNKALDGTKDSMDDLADSTGKATKAAKNLLSFDEVFRLKEPDEGTDSGITADTDFELPDIDTEAFIPEVPSFEGFAKNFVGDLISAIKDKLLGAGIGALLGGILGGILGGPLGAKIGAIAGAIAGWFWNDIAEALGLTDVGKIAVPIATGLGAIIGGIAGGPLGALVGAGIGALVGWLVDSIARGIETGDWSKVGYPLGIGLGAGIGMIVGGPGGAVIGGAIGLLVGWISDQIITGINTGEWDFSKLGLGLGTGIGAAIGTVVGGPAGTLIGGAIGALVGWIGGLIADNWDSIVAWFSDAFDAIGDFFSNIGTYLADIWDSISTAVSNWVSGVWNTLTTGLSNIWKGIKYVFSNLGTIIKEGFFNSLYKIGDVIGAASGYVANFAVAIKDSLLAGLQHIKDFVANAWDAFAGFFTKTIPAIWEGLKNVFSNLGPLLKESFFDTMYRIGDAIGAASGYVANFGVAIKDALLSGLQYIKDFVANAWDALVGFFTETIPALWNDFKDGWVTFWTETFPSVLGNIASFFAEAGKKFISFFTETIPNAWRSFKEAWSTFWSETFPAVLGSIAGFFVEAGKKFISFFTETIPRIWSGFKEAWSTFWTETFPSVLGSIAGFFADALNAFVSFFTETIPGIWNSFKEGWHEFWYVTFPSVIESIGSFFGNLWNTFTEWGKNIIEGFVQGFKGAWDFVWEAISEFFRGFIDGFQRTFGIHSPATSTEPLGENVILGFIQGMLGAVGQLLEAIASIGAQVIGAMGNWLVDTGSSIATWVSDTASSIGSWASSTASTFFTWTSERASDIARWTVDTAKNIGSWASDCVSKVGSFVSDTASSIASWASDAGSRVLNWVSETRASISNWATTSISNVGRFVSSTASNLASFVSNGVSNVANFTSSTLSNIGSWASNMVSRAGSAMSSFRSNVASGLSGALSNVGNFCVNAMSMISSWASNFGSWISNTISNAASAVSSFVSSVGSRISNAVSSARSASNSGQPRVVGRIGHAVGGVFNREHIARFAEGNKAEAIIPLENASAMQPFVDAVSHGLTQTLAPMFATISGGDQNQLQPLYVGTLIADDSGLKELERKMRIIRIKEERRGV